MMNCDVNYVRISGSLADTRSASQIHIYNVIAAQTPMSQREVRKHPPKAMKQPLEG